MALQWGHRALLETITKCGVYEAAFGLGRTGMAAACESSRGGGRDIPSGSQTNSNPAGAADSHHRGHESRKPSRIVRRRFIHKGANPVNIETPFPDRPATPFWDPRGQQPGMAGLGDYSLSNGQPCDPGLMGPVLCQDTTQRILQAIAAGTATAAQVAAGTPLITGQSSYANCPVGTIYNPSTLTCQPGVGLQASASGNGMILLLIAGAVLFFMSRR
jgi:hypothetical protein